jgi:type IV pilus assembly protein PilC
MPYFMWRGVTLFGDIKRGKIFAHDTQELSALLLEREIALLHSKKSTPLWSWAPIPLSTTMSFFHQLGRLLRAGVLLPQALSLIVAQSNHARFQETVHTIAHAVYAGSSFSLALSRHPTIFTPLMVHICRVGEESGTLVHACQILYEYMHIMRRFKQALRNALLMPCITAIAFVVIGMVIVVYIVPRFVTLFATMNAQLPPITQFLIKVSALLQGWMLLFLGLGTILGSVGVVACARSARGRIYTDRMMLHIPSINYLVLDVMRMHFTRALGALVQAGVSVPYALPLAIGTIHNRVLYAYAHHFQEAIQNGSSLSRAMAQHPEQWFDQQSIAMINVGEESGDLARALQAVADYYQDRVEQRLHWYALVVQPLLVVILGLIIALFVCAIYMPLFTLAQVI